MLTIRREQLETFNRLDVDKFEEWMLVHLNRFFPPQCRAMGETELRQFVRTGIKRAARYEITSKRDVCKFIDLAVAFGPDFDTDASWAPGILSAPMSSGQKMWKLYRAAYRELRS
jgi:hypothetical protein